MGNHVPGAKAKRRKTAFIGVLAGLGMLGMAYASFNLIRQPLPELPDVIMSAREGQPVSISDFKGQPTVVNLWASWCAPCRREMPALQQGQLENPDIHFVFPNQGETIDIINTYLTEEGLALENVLLDPDNALADGIASRGLPTTLFLDHEGRIVDIRLGELSPATLQERLNALRSR